MSVENAGEALKGCERPAGYFYGRVVDETGESRYESRVIPCGKWSCPVCRKVKARALMARALKGSIVEEAKTAGFREAYNYKLLTLTCPGKEYRDRKRPEEAAKEMRDAFKKMIDVMRAEVGMFGYLRVMEAHQSGYPHYHVLLVGPAISGKWVLRWIESLWRDRYHMGFVKMNVIRGEDGKGDGL